MTTTLTVAQLTSAIKQQLESRFSYVAVRGEVSNLKVQSSGHIYFTLKDKDAQIAVALFRGSASSQQRLPKEGDQIVVKGELSVYAPRGNYQIIARQIEFAGVGELLQKLHELKLKLQGLGWFSPDLKKKIPRFPKTIGVVTSPTGSVIQDILNVLTRRLSNFHLILNPVRVQGDGAAQEIAQAIKDFNQFGLADVLIVGRGGGSIEDLWPFNEEIVAAAIYESKIPIISAVGHETDTCISDFVADLRAPTPSAAAEIISADKSELLLQLSKTRLRLSQTVQSHIRSQKRALDLICRQSPLASPNLVLAPFHQRLDEMKADLSQAADKFFINRRFKLESLKRQHKLLSPKLLLSTKRTELTKLRAAFYSRTLQIVKRKAERLNALKTHLEAIDPRHLLTKGFAIVFHEKTGSIMLSSNEAVIGEQVRIQLKDGQMTARIEKSGR